MRPLTLVTHDGIAVKLQPGLRRDRVLLTLGRFVEGICPLMAGYGAVFDNTRNGWWVWTASLANVLAVLGIDDTDIESVPAFMTRSAPRRSPRP